MAMSKDTISKIIQVAQAVLAIIAGFLGGAVTAEAATLFSLY